MSLMVWVGGRKSSHPSVFDLFLVGMFVTPFLRDNYLKGMYFVFYSIFLFLLTTLMQPRRKYRSWPLSLLLLWSFLSIFVHNNVPIVENAIINYYINVAMMFEGFIYVLCGVLLIRSIVIYSSRPLYLYAFLPIAMIGPMKQILYSGQITLLAAAWVAVVVFLVLHKEYFISGLVTIVGLALATLKWSWVVMKFTCRPLIWKELTRQILTHPWIGTGLNHTLDPDNMVFIQRRGTIYGLTYRHNDILSAGAYLGIIVIILILIFAMLALFRARHSWHFLPLCTLFLASWFQMTFFWPDKAAIGLVLIAVGIKATLQGGEA